MKIDLLKPDVKYRRKAFTDLYLGELFVWSEGYEAPEAAIAAGYKIGIKIEKIRWVSVKDSLVSSVDNKEALVFPLQIENLTVKALVE